MAPAPSAPPTAQTQDSRADAVTESAAPARAQARSELRGAPSRELDVNAVDPQGRTALMRAALQGDAERVRQLIEAGADPLRRDREGLSAADLARAAGHEALLPLLEPGSAPTR
jgi:ankyrin repeat protein